ncbi:hypothetical protein [Streptomyces albicerus]|uniref:hypothetical protein n=1 Tax=Streptomyces albicerus TaxID=2569859 RepID=UPI00124B83B5|nr:hypothetical protein [Streptomyces albicerus]
MAESSWPDPAASRVVNDLQYERLVAVQHVDGLLGDPPDQALVFADGSALSVFLRASRYAQLRGHGWTSGTAQLTKTITSNTSGQTRVDLVVLGLNRSTWAVTSYVKQGTPGAGVPALQLDTGDTGIFEIPLAEVTVLNNASVIPAGDVKVRHWYVRPDGYASAGPETRPVIAPVGGLLTENNAKYMWNGSIWKNISDPATPQQSVQSVFLNGSADITGDSTWRDFPGAKWPALTFTVPQSGRCYVTIGGWIQNVNTTSAVIWMSYRASGGGFATGTDGTLMDPRDISTRGGRLNASKRRLFTGLTPGASVTLTPVYFASSANSDADLTFARYGNLIMEPA